MQHCPEQPANAIDKELLTQLSQIIDPARILGRSIDRIAFASDASLYRLVPRVVVCARGIEDIQALFRFSHQHSIPLTFRAAGTSLSGQAVTNGILVEVARYWRGISVLDQGKRIRVQPGVIGAHANLQLRPYRTKIGPDPASIDACMMGGILANNSSGMCCGTVENAYHTLHSLKFVLPSGTTIDTSDCHAAELFEKREPGLSEGLSRLKLEIERDPVVSARIRHKYRLKNTVGYSLNAFTDFERPIDIFGHLLIGSEGTLAFIAEAVLNTIPLLPVKYTGLLLFADLRSACAAIAPLRDAGAKALELMDSVSLRSSNSALWQVPDGSAGLLVEFQAAEETDRHTLETRACEVIRHLDTLDSLPFTHDPIKQDQLWKIRKGLFPSVGSTRPAGTSVIIEDIVFPIERLAGAVTDLRTTLAHHGYENAIIFGHAKDGNLHFVIAQSFDNRKEIDRYARLMDAVVHLVVERYGGSLKGEHGTGRNMAPFVETEWGSQLFGIMRRIKSLADPRNLLNPGVIINADPTAHLQSLKNLPRVETEVDKCIECGYCESRCPSRDLTLSPRQRIVVRREIVRLESSQNCDGIASAVDEDFQYDFLDTCAVDGLCALACPVGIDTGSLTKKLRSVRHSAAAHTLSEFCAENMRLLEQGVRFFLRAGHFAQSLLGLGFMTSVTRLVRKTIGDFVPLWTADVPYAALAIRPYRTEATPDAIYFPSCISRTLGHVPAELADLSSTDAAVQVARRANVSLFVPIDIAGTCCGVPFSSKGYDRAHAIAANRAIGKFWQWSDAGRLPIVIDTSPCTYGLLTCRNNLNEENRQKYDALRIVDSVSFAHDYLLPRLAIKRQLNRVALHPVCSLIKMGLTQKISHVAQACSRSVFVPMSSGCCGFAGDRGFSFPELTAAATRELAAEIAINKCDGYYSSSPTCEIAMTRSTGQFYRSYIHLLEQATR